MDLGGGNQINIVVFANRPRNVFVNPEQQKAFEDRAGDCALEALRSSQ